MQQSGVLLINKPAGLTSAEVIRRLKRKFGIEKIGHAGTLDPMATGLLVVLIGKATKLQFLFLESSKEYSGTISLGTETDTDDVTGQVLKRDEELSFINTRLLDDWISEIKKAFSGEQEQLPPAVSAVKVDGKRSYKLAREGKSPELAPRTVQIEFNELSFIEPERIRYHVTCSKGTYVRSLARDIGRFLGSYGCLETICRLGSGSFRLEQAPQLECVLDSDLSSLIIPVSELLGELPRLTLDKEACLKICLGDQSALNSTEKQNLSGEGAVAGLFDDDEVFYGLVQLEQGTNWRVRCILHDCDT